MSVKNSVASAFVSVVVICAVVIFLPRQNHPKYSDISVIQNSNGSRGPASVDSASAVSSESSVILFGHYELRVEMAAHDHSMMKKWQAGDPSASFKNTFHHGAAKFRGIVHTSDGAVEVVAQDQMKIRGIPSGSVVKLSSRPLNKNSFSAQLVNSTDQNFKSIEGQSFYLTDYGSAQSVSSIQRNSKTHRVMVVLFNNTEMSPQSATVEAARDYYFSEKPGSFQYEIQKITKGNVQIYGDVFPKILSGPKCWDYWAADTARDMAVQSIKRANPNAEFDTLFLVMPRNSGCSNPNFATVGAYPVSYENGEVTFSTSWLNWYPSGNDNIYTNIAIHEFGHNLGLTHASRLHCPSSFFDSSQVCSYDEYWDPHDIMGSGSFYYGSGFSATQFAKMGWLGKSQVVEISSSRDVTIAETNSNNLFLPKVVRIPMPDARVDYFGNGVKYIYLDYVGTQNFANGVYVRGMGAGSNLIGFSQQNGNMWISWLENPNDEMTFAELGISVKLLSRTNADAKLKISFTNPVNNNWPTKITSAAAGTGGNCQSLAVDVTKATQIDNTDISFTVSDLYSKRMYNSINFTTEQISPTQTRFWIRSSSFNTTNPLHIELNVVNQLVSTSRVATPRNCDPNIVPSKIFVNTRKADPNQCQNTVISGSSAGLRPGEQLNLFLFQQPDNVMIQSTTNVQSDGSYSFFIGGLNTNHSHMFSILAGETGAATFSQTIPTYCLHFPRYDLEFRPNAFVPNGCGSMKATAHFFNEWTTDQTIQIEATHSGQFLSSCQSLPVVTRCCGIYSQCQLLGLSIGDYQLLTAKHGSAKTWAFAKRPSCN